MRPKIIKILSLIVNSVFENNAGAALEFLANSDGSETPVSRNVTVVDCTFRNNNWAKIYPNAGQIQIVNWTVDNRPTGIVYNCRFENPKDVDSINGDGDLSGLIAVDNKSTNYAELNVI